MHIDSAINILVTVSLSFIVFLLNSIKDEIKENKAAITQLQKDLYEHASNIEIHSVKL